MANKWLGSSASFGHSRCYEIQDDYTVSANDAGTVFFLNDTAASIAVTLPPISDLSAGWGCKFIVKGLVAGGQNYTITQGNAADEFYGHVRDGSADGLGDVADGSADTKIQFTATAAAGQWIEIITDGDNWYCFGAENTTAKLTFEN